MKVRDMFTQEFYNKYCDVDVYDSVCEELSIAFCGALLTDKAKEEYALVLDDEVNMYCDNCNAVVELSHLPEGLWQKHLKMLKKLFYDCAGYGPADEYDEYFMEVEDYVPDYTKEFIEALKKDRGYDYIAQNYWKMSQLELANILLEYIYDPETVIEELESRMED